MRKAKITREQIIESAISLTSQNGLEHITTKKIALDLGISEGSVLYYFSNKQELLMESLFHIDRQIDDTLRAANFTGFKLMSNIKQMWIAYFEFFLTHPGYAKFYRNFRHSSYYTKEVMLGQRESFSFFSKFLLSYSALLGLHIDIFWIYVIETTLNFAVHMNDGGIERNDKNIDHIFRMISYGMYGVFKKYKEKDFDIEIPPGHPLGKKTPFE